MRSRPRAAELHFERWYLRALIALARRDHAESTIAGLVPRLTATEAELASAREADPLTTIARRLRLDRVFEDLLAAAAAFAGEPRLGPHVEALGGPLARHGLSLATFCELAQLGPEAGMQLVAGLVQGHPLLAFGLLSAVDTQVTAFLRPYQAPARLLAYLAGADACEPGIAVVAPNAGWIYDDTQRGMLESIRRALGAPGAPHILIDGNPGTGRCSAVAVAAGGAIVVLDAERLSADALATSTVALAREAFLRDAVPVIADPELGDHGPEPARAGLALDTIARQVVVVSSRPGTELVTSRPIVRLRWPVPDAAHRRALWVAYGTRDGAAPAGDLDVVAMRYRVGPGAVVRAIRSATTLHDGPLDAEALSAGLRHNIGERMAHLAQRVEVTQSWDDVVLAEDILDQIVALVSRVRHGPQVLDGWGYRRKIARGTGIAALFSGPPGTGKTMVAGLIARELDLELYQVDLSQVVSKWVGETEKQLARVFDAAEEGHALLLFDEADALFGQRSSEVGGAVDRYANLEVNFLLQRIEAFGGITILTTNLDAAIDRALKRRLAAHIVFAMPDDEERALLWQRLVDTGAAPLARDLDPGRLAREFPLMSGANIRNAAFAAAFMAAAESASEIGQKHLLRAARAEYRSMGHVLAERSLGRSGLS